MTLLPLLTCRTAHWSDLMGDAEFLDRTLCSSWQTRSAPQDWGGRAGHLAARARAFHVRAAVCKLRTFALVTFARAARSRSSSLQVCGACSRRDPAKTYSECVLGDTSPARMLVSPRGLAQLNAEGGVEFLDNEGNTVSSNTSLLRHFVEFHGRTYNCHPDAVDLDRSLRLVLGLRPRWSAHTGACAHSRSAPPLRAVGAVLLLGRPRG